MNRIKPLIALAIAIVAGINVYTAIENPIMYNNYVNAEAYNTGNESLFGVMGFPDETREETFEVTNGVTVSASAEVKIEGGFLYVKIKGKGWVKMSSQTQTSTKYKIKYHICTTTNPEGCVPSCSEPETVHM